MLAAALCALLGQDPLLTRLEDLLPAPQVEPHDRPFYLGSGVGYVANRDAEEGAWSLNVFARARLSPEWSLEAAVSYYFHEYAGDDVRAARVPVQLSILWFPFRPDVLRPYLGAGPGVYPFFVDYKDSLERFADEDDVVFGAHVGGGAEMQMGTAFSALFDFRFLILDDPELNAPRADEVDFNSWQITIGFGVLF